MHLIFNQNKVQNQNIVADIHNDLPFHVYRMRKQGMTRVIETLYLPDILKGNINLIVCAIFVDEVHAGDWTNNAREQIKALFDDVSESADKLEICTTFEQICNAIAASRVALLISFEGCEPMTTVDSVNEFYSMGMRLMSMTWSRRNKCGEGCSYAMLSEYETPRAGLTKLGFAVLERACSLGILIDVTHLSAAGVKDVFSTGAPNVFASHSNAQAILPSRRNISDEQIIKIANNGGVIGINGFVPVVCRDCKNPISNYCDHIDHISRLVGVKHVALGIDLYEFFYKCNKSLPDINTFKSGNELQLDTFNGYSELPLLQTELVRRGYSQGEIDLIYGENFMSFLQTSL